MSQPLFVEWFGIIFFSGQFFQDLPCFEGLGLGFRVGRNTKVSKSLTLVRFAFEALKILIPEL